ncbi:MAG: DEAD/DEAH box helicase family protein [Chloroflexi bacterium]|nr:DEAD/DEAH box helicase family protein [Chloroflexota bacterium]
MDDVTGERREFIDNRDANTVAEAIRQAGAYYGHSREIAIASGYFNLGGFSVIADALEAAPRVRILLGSEPEPPRPRRTVLPGTPPTEQPLRERLGELRASLEADRDLVPFAPDAVNAVERLVAFLDRPTTEVKIYRREFLHGKAFIFGDEAGVLAGSANFTAAGLLHNLELDLGAYAPHQVKAARAWFDDLWEQAEPFDLAGVYRALEIDYDPHTIYLRMLYELYGAELAEEVDELPRTPGATLQLTEFQRLGVTRALRILDRWGGVLIADGVGLGKTFTAGGLIEFHLQAKGWRVLVVAPASLRDANWEGFLAAHTKYAVEVVSYQELANDLQVGDPPEPGRADGRKAHLKLDASEYRCIVIDEAHAFRSSETTYYRALRRLMAAGGVEKRLIMLTATPVNNSLWDLYWQLLLFARTESRFAEIGIANLREYIVRALGLDLEALTPAHLFPLLDAVSVRRTRTHIKRFFPGATLNTPEGPVPLIFPTPKLHRVGYDSARPADAANAGEFFDQVATAIGGGLSMARYQPDLYRLGGEGAPAQQVTSALLLSQLLKRFESSLEAFRRTLGKMIGSHDRFLEILDRGYVAVPRVSPEAFDAGLDDAELDMLLVEDPNARPTSEYLAADLRARVVADRDLLRTLLTRATTIDAAHDPKLDALLDTLARIDGAATHADERKVVLFSYFADTVDYLHRFLETTSDPRMARYRSRIGVTTGAASSETRQHIVWSFVPLSSGAPPGTAEEIDLMLSTDVLAEGQNLQQAGTVINFDLPWNPMRLVQRNGRVDRIGSKHDVVHLYTFFPDQELDRLLDLEANLRRKIAQANAAVGVETVVIPGDDPVERVFDDTRAEIERIAAEDAGFIDEKEAELDAFSGEVFREELRQALMQAREGELKSLPWGIGSGFRAARPSGVVFAARAGSRVEWRFVPFDAGDLSSDRLALLGLARCSEMTARNLPDDVRARLFELWDLARDAILADRQAELDPATRAAAVPKAQRDAVSLLFAAMMIEPAVQERVIEALQAPWPLTVSRALRGILDRPDASDSARVDQIVAYVEGEGLRAPRVPVEPAVGRDDIHLVCYQVVTA